LAAQCWKQRAENGTSQEDSLVFYNSNKTNLVFLFWKIAISFSLKYIKDLFPESHEKLCMSSQLKILIVMAVEFLRDFSCGRWVPRPSVMGIIFAAVP